MSARPGKTPGSGPMPDARHGSYHPIRLINNTCTIVLSLLYGEDGLQKEIACLPIAFGRPSYPSDLLDTPSLPNQHTLPSI